jgi:hypothetical protein
MALFRESREREDLNPRIRHDPRPGNLKARVTEPES